MNIARVFEDDVEFRDWTKDQPGANMINSRANRSDDYIAVKSAICRTIVVSRAAVDARTTAACRQVGGRNLRFFDEWIPQNITKGICVSDACVIRKPRDWALHSAALHSSSIPDRI